MPQLTLRSGLTGFVLGAVLSATGLYIGAKAGIAVGVGLISVILAFALFHGLSACGLATDFTVLENNCTQSIATASGYVATPLFSSLAAYMLITGVIPPWWQLALWIFVVALVGVLIAFPLKRRFINEDQAPFPEGYACGVVLDSLYDGSADEGLFKARLLGISAGVTAAYQALISDGWMRLLQFKILMLDKWAGLREPWLLHERLDDYYYAWATRVHAWLPNLLGTDVRILGLRIALDASMLGVGGVMGIAVATSCLLGAAVNFVVLAPLMIRLGDIAPRVGAAGVLMPLNRAEIVNQWSLWWAVTMMVVGAAASLVSRPELLLGAFKRRRARSATPVEDVLKHIEVPLWISYAGLAVCGPLACYLTHAFFGMPFWLALVSLPLIFVLTIICTNSMALTSWTPVGALSKITQFTMGAFSHANPAANLMPAGMTAEIAANAANLLSDIKPGYMLGGKPRHQVVGHLIGNLAGVLTCVPLFFLLFLPPAANGVRSASTIVSDQFAMPSAMQWKGVAEIITRGVHGLPLSALVSMGVAAICAAAMEIARIRSKGRFQLSAVATGLGVVLPPEYTLAMFEGALFFFVAARARPAGGTRGARLWVDGKEALCAGLITGSALMGIGNAILDALF